MDIYEIKAIFETKEKAINACKTIKDYINKYHIDDPIHVYEIKSEYLSDNVYYFIVETTENGYLKVRDWVTSIGGITTVRAI